MVFFYDEDFSAVFLFLGYPQFLAPVFQYFLHNWNLFFWLSFDWKYLLFLCLKRNKVHVGVNQSCF